jgi:3,4-dihydroxy 2-butanone 4-phosphate synthase/GTP cyclohydrolase II
MTIRVNGEGKMSFARIEEAIEEIRRGHMVILVDDEDRENEGDLTMAAEMATPEHVNFMARFGRGLVCVTMTDERARRPSRPLRTIAPRPTISPGRDIFSP